MNRVPVAGITIPLLFAALGYWFLCSFTGYERAFAQEAPAPDPEAMRLRNLGVAYLENEKPAEAEKLFRHLVDKLPNEPLSYTNLAIALLRQNKAEEARHWIDQALQKVPPGKKALLGHLLTVRSEILTAQGEAVAALQALHEAALAAPDSVRIHFALYRAASAQRELSKEAPEALTLALDGLVRLRPENLVVLLERGRRAIEVEDRATATAIYLRIREISWQGSEAAHKVLETVLDALAAATLPAARLPAQRLANLLVPTPAYRASLRELSTGTQALPLERFLVEPPSSAFGDPLPIRFDGEVVANTPTRGAAMMLMDLDGDDRPDIVRVPDGEPASLEVRLTADGWRPRSISSPFLASRLLAVDLANQGHLDLVGFQAERLTLWRSGDPALLREERGILPGSGATLGEAFDFDLDGDLDLAMVRGDTLELLRKSGENFEAVGAKSLPPLNIGEIRDLAASDLDRDGDLDLIVAHDRGLLWLDNLSQGRFAERTVAGGLAAASGAAAVVSADLDNDGLPDLASAGQSLQLWHNAGGQFERWALDSDVTLSGTFRDLLAFDADNDGRLDLAAAGDAGVLLLGRQPDQKFRRLELRSPPGASTTVAAADLDADGDLDLVVAGPSGLHWLKNRGGNRNQWLEVRLRGLTQGSSKNNLHGLGATLELWAGTAYQFREVTGAVTHLGLGKLTEADLLRVTWTNGVPENRLQPRSAQSITEKQVLKGSCPFLYVWTGKEFEFATDLLWGAPIGMPIAADRWAEADPEELVKVEGTVHRDGRYELRVTEELWEAAFFDFMRLWVVDHPAEVEVASSLRFTPGTHRPPDTVLGSRLLHSPQRAWDGRGREVTARILERDEVYADGYELSPYQGVAREPWSFTFDLGEAPARPLRLHLDGWIFPADASLNLAISQRHDLPYLPPRLEMETKQGWRVLVPAMGAPSGKTKTLVVDTPALPQGVRRLRIVTSFWLSWDRIAWTVEKADGQPVVRARLAPTTAKLRFRGFSEPVRRAPNAPHGFDYRRLQSASPWYPLAGLYTRYGDVRELLEAADDRSVILASGDEMALVFDGRQIPPPPPGWRRTVFLESHGWDKDADRNTYEGRRLEPLPFREMSGYPPGSGTSFPSFPNTPELNDYRRRWLTREVKAVRVLNP